MGFGFACKVHNVIACCATKYQQVEQRVGAQTVSAVNADTGAFADCVQAIDHGIVAAGRLCDHLAVNVGGNAAHLVVDGRHHRNGFFGDVHVGKVDANFVHRRQALVNGFCTQVVQFQEHIVFVGATATSFFDFLVHRARHEVARRQVFQCRRIALHETLAIAVEQNGAFTAATFCEQHTSAGHACGVKLPEFHVFQRNASAGSHAQAVAGVDEGIGGRRKDAACAACGQQHSFGVQNVQVACFHFEGCHAHHVAFGIADQVKGHPLHEEAGFGFDVLLVQGVQHGVTGAVGRGTGTLNRLLAIVGGVTTKRPLVNGAVWVAIEGHAHVFKVVHHFRGFTTHEFNGILVA